MSYARATQRFLGSLGDPSTTFRMTPVPRGDYVKLRFRGVGVNTSNAQPVFDAISSVVQAGGHFDPPEYMGWGPSGTLEFYGRTRSSNYTLPQIADFMVGMATRASQRTGKQITAFNAKHCVTSACDNRTGEDWEIAPTGRGNEATEGSARAAQRGLVARLANIRQRTSAIFGVDKMPEYTPSQLRNIVTAAGFLSMNPVLVYGAVRSTCIWGVAKATKILAGSELMVRGISEGVPGAARDALLQQADAKEGLDTIETILSKMEQLSRSTGLGAVQLVIAGVAIPIGYFIAAVAAIVTVIIAAMYFANQETATERAEAFCEARERVTGQACTPEEMERIMRDYVADIEREDERSFWGNLNRAAGKGLGIVITVAVVGLGAWAAFQAYSFYKAARTTGKLASVASQTPKLTSSVGSQD